MRIFLACPLTPALRRCATTGRHTLDPELVRLLTGLERAMQSSGHEVFLAHRVEEFGAKLRPPLQCTPLDMLEMQRADCVVAIPGNSYGVHIELGWASAMGKPIVLVRERGAAHETPLLAGLEAVAGARSLFVPPDLLADTAAQSALQTELLRALAEVRPARPERPNAFVSTAFGFGPASKATTIAEAWRRRHPGVALHFFGAGIDREFAAKSGVFDRIYRVDVDDPAALADLVPLLRSYSRVFSVMNFGLLPLWSAASPPLYLVDSLAWMWDRAPAALDNARAYFVQDYLLDGREREAWRQAPGVHLVPPLAPAPRPAGRSDGRRTLLINLSGCANPLTDGALYRRYASEMSAAVLTAAAGRYDEFVVCCRDDLAATVLAAAPEGLSLRAGHVPRDAFLELLATADDVLTTPGVTTTLEALGAGRSPRFLLPQNYSQALICERYLRQAVAPAHCLALSRFGSEFTVPEALDERAGVAHCTRLLERILGERTDDLRAMARALVAAGDGAGEALRTHFYRPAARAGQEIILDSILGA